MDYLFELTRARVGWLSISGIIALTLLCAAVIGYVAERGGLNSLIASALINLAALTLDYLRNA
jgi:hypothetical protein